MRRASMLFGAALGSIVGSEAVAQEIQLAGAVAGDPTVLARNRRLVEASAIGGTIGRIPTGAAGDIAMSTLVPVGGVDVRVSFPWRWPAIGPLRHALGMSFLVGEGPFVSAGDRRARLFLLDPTYAAGCPIAHSEEKWRLDWSGSVGLSGIVVQPKGTSFAVFSGGLRVSTELALNLAKPQLRFALASGLSGRRSQWIRPGARSCSSTSPQALGGRLRSDHRLVSRRFSRCRPQPQGRGRRPVGRALDAHVPARANNLLVHSCHVVPFCAASRGCDATAVLCAPLRERQRSTSNPAGLRDVEGRPSRNGGSGQRVGSELRNTSA